jgi:hypothetical protein
LKFFLFLAVLLLPGFSFSEDLYQTHCASCHGVNRLGGMGPALLPENLQRLKKPEAARMIAESRPGVQMPRFREKLDDAQIARLVELIYSPPVPVPQLREAATPTSLSWTATGSRRSRASPRATRCTAGRSSPPTGASSTSPRATAGSRSTTCGT